ncbi:hypothetical protein [Gordonia rhizosphera]|uniref:Uncharacterized protein n=1 Tax=Gordonia rhizosphera NBRC 16068 TaxID=1108045 RepID=K6WHR3_9ACTN|nr:hypothetical protein [Gordonia rhizosphera]GAB93291.1 hypothetical protein GORHZ_213_00670 [Gordonia rhizosphera NBRC 16068]
MIEPQGPLPPEIYWRRRVVAIGGVALVIALVVVLIVWATGGDSNPDNTAAQSSATSSTTASAYPSESGASESADAYGGYGGSGGSGGSGGGGGTAGGTAASASAGAPVPSGVADTPVPVPASGLCPDSNISVVLYTDKPTYTTGDQPVFTIVTTNAGLTECTRDVGKAAQDVIVRTLDGTRTLWSARDCSPLQTVNNVTLKPSQQVRDTITWSGTTSTPGCDTPRVPVPVGSYQAIGKIGEKESAPITFNVVAPAQP